LECKTSSKCLKISISFLEFIIRRKEKTSIA
jgi:hypothetical protein